MKIAELEVIPVAFPDPPLRNSWGVHEPLALRTVVRLRTDDGHIGLGETYGGVSILQELEAARRKVLGEDPYHLERLRALIRSPRAYAPVEVACLDAIGHATGRPVCDLLGGKVRDEVAFSAYLFFKYNGEDEWGEVLSPEQMIGLAKSFVERYGFRTLKLKGGVLRPQEELRTMRLLRQEFGDDYQLRIDPNAVWSVETSVRIIRKMRELDPEYIEDPTWGITGMSLVAKNVDVPLSTNMCVTSFEHIPDAVRAGAVDVILSDHHYWGGLLATKTLASVCDTFHLGLSMHSNSHLGISLAAMVHVASTIPNLVYACDTHYPWLQEDIIAGSRPRFEDGRLAVSSAPGLGVSLDEEKLARMSELYHSVAGLERDDAAEMRRRAADWLPMRPKW